MKNRSTSLPSLPNAIYDDNGLVPVDFLREVFGIVHQPGHFAKAVCRLVKENAHGTLDSKLELIAEHLPRQEFRLSWYREFAQARSKKKQWPPFYYLLWKWLIKDNQVFDYETDAETKEYFFDSGNSVLLNTDQVYELVELTQSRGTEPRKVALFLWCQAEFQAYIGKPDGNSSLLESILNTLREAKEDSYVSEVYRQLCIPEDDAQTKSATRGAKSSNDDDFANDLDHHQQTPDLVETPADHNAPVKIPVEAAKKLSDISAHLDSCLEEKSRIAEELDQSNTIYDSNNLQKLSQRVNSLSTECERTCELCSDYCSWLEDRLLKLQNLAIGKAITSTKSKSIGLGEQWMAEQNALLDRVGQFEREIIQMSGILQQLGEHGHDVSFPKTKLDFEDAISWLKENTPIASNNLNDLRLVEQKKFIAINEVSSGVENLDAWGWLKGHGTLDALLIDNQGKPVDTILLGLALRLNLDTEPADVTDVVPRLNDLASQRPLQVVSIFSQLGEGQAHSLWDHSHTLRPLIRLGLIFAALEGDSPDTSSSAHRLYWEPLKDLHSMLPIQVGSARKTTPDKIMALILNGIVQQEFRTLGELHEKLNSQAQTGARKVEKLSSEFSKLNPDSGAGHVAETIFDCMRFIKEDSRLPFPLAKPIPNLAPSAIKETFESSSPISELYPVSFGKFYNGEVISWGDYLADSIMAWSGCIEQEKLVAKWIEDDQLDVLWEFCVRDPQYRFQGRLLKKWVGEKRSAILKQLQKKLKATELRVQNLPESLKKDLSRDIDRARDRLEKGNLKEINKDLSALEELVRDALIKLGSEEEREKLAEDIECLGGSVEPTMSLEQIRMLKEELLRKSKKRQKHLEPIIRLLSFQGITELIRKEAQLTLEALQQPQSLPSEKKAEWYHLLFTTALEPLMPFIESPQLYHPEISSNVSKILLTSLKVIRRLVEPDEDYGKEEEVLEMISSEKFASPGGAENLLVNVSGAAREIGIEIPDFEHFTQADTVDLDPEPKPKPAVNQVTPTVNLEQLREFLWQQIEKAGIEPYSSNLAKAIALDELVSKGSWHELSRHFYTKLKDFDEKRVRPGNRFDRDLFDCAFTFACQSDFSSTDTQDLRNSSLLFLENCGNSFFLEHKEKSTQLYAKIFALEVLKWLVQDSCGDDRSLRKNEPQSFSRLVQVLVKADRELNTLKRGGEWLFRCLGPSAAIPDDKYESTVMQSLWDLASGERLAADFRGWLMKACESNRVYGALSFLLQQSPYGLKHDRAQLACKLLQNVSDERSENVLRSFLDTEVRKSVSKPFQIFAQSILSKRSKNHQWPILLTVGDRFEKTTDEGIWVGSIKVVPVTEDPPQVIGFKIADKVSRVHFEDGSTRKVINGPFLHESNHKILLRLPKNLPDTLPIEMEIRVKTIQERTLKKTETWRLDLGDASKFEHPSAKEIERAFDNFPNRPMRGEDYVPRDEDEGKIEHVLFDSSSAGSLWITSPRRSGKTTMLYRILDEYSFRKNRDDIVLYFTLSKGFPSGSDFNKWVWQRIANDKDNKILAEITGPLGNIRKELDYEIDVDNFLEDLAKRILEHTNPGARVYYVFDEIDQFVQMVLGAEDKRDMAMEILWQLRNLIQNNDDIGIVLSGSHASRKFFVLDPEAPFYNSIHSLTLAPFSTHSEQAENRARQVTQPRGLRQVFDVPMVTLDEILRITSGIPYYMKILAGATYSIAKQKRIYPPDVKDGLRQLFSKKTGLNSIDGLENPGEDELRTLYSRDTLEKVLIKGILLAAANISSPLDASGVLRGDFWSESSPLVVDAALSRRVIEKGLNATVEMGFLEPCEDEPYRVQFAIPILGESLRFRFKSMWAEISRNLEKLGEER